MSSEATHDRPLPRWVVAAVAVGLLAIAFALRLTRLSACSLWYDEAFGLMIARQPWGEMNRLLALDVHPPLWFWTLHLWGTESVLWARLLSVILGALTPPLMWLLMRRPLGTWTALVAAALLAVHPVHIHYSQELRMYTQVTLLILLTLRVAVGLADDAGTWRRWTLLSMLAWMTMITQYQAGFAVGGVWLGLLGARLGRLDRRWLTGWFLSGAVAIGAVVPWLLRATAWHMVDGSGKGARHWQDILIDLLESTQGLVRRPPWEWVGLETSAGTRIVFTAIVGVAIPVLAGVGAWVMIRDPRRRAAGWVLVGALATGLGLLFVYQAVGFLFFARHYMVLIVPLVLLIAVALGAGPRWWRAVGTATLLLVMLSHSAALLMAAGGIRDCTQSLARWIAIRAPERTPPIVCNRMFLGLPLVAQLSDREVLILEDEETTVGQRALLGEERLIRDWPESWQNMPVWVVVSNWGNLPLRGGGLDQEAIRQQALEAVRNRGGTATEAQLLIFEAAAGGFKWGAVVEVR